MGWELELGRCHHTSRALLLSSSSNFGDAGGLCYLGGFEVTPSVIWGKRCCPSLWEGREKSQKSPKSQTKPKGLHPPFCQEQIHKNVVFFPGKTPFPAGCWSRGVGFSSFFWKTGNNSPLLSPGTPRASRSTWQRRCQPSESLLPLSSPGNSRVPLLLIDHVPSFLSGDWPLLLNLF